MTTKIRGLWTLGLAGVMAASAARAGAEAPKRGTPAAPAIAMHETRVSDQTRMRAEAQLDSCVAKVEKTARRQGESVVAGRMAHELGLDPAVLMNEQATLGCFLGDLLIAHSLQANAQSSFTASRLVQLHDGGMGWADIAIGLGLRLSHVVRGLVNETRVAAGLSRGDGKVAAMKREAPPTLVTRMPDESRVASREDGRGAGGNGPRAGEQK